MTLECAGRGKLTQLVAYHVLSDINRNELVSVMNCDRMAYEVRRNHAGA